MSSSKNTQWEKFKRTCFILICVVPISLYAFTQTAIELRFAFINQHHSLSDNIHKREGLFYLNDAHIRPDLGFGSSTYSIDVHRKESSNQKNTYVQETRWVLVFPLTPRDTPSEENVQAWLAIMAKNQSEIDLLSKRALNGTLYHHSDLVRKPYRVQAFSFDFIQVRWLRKILSLLFDTKGNRKEERTIVSAASIAVSRACTKGRIDSFQCSTSAPVLYLGRGYGTFLGLGLTSWLTLSIVLVILLIKVQRVYR